MDIKSFETRIAEYISAHGLLLHDGGPVLVTLSGGADSVALLSVLAALGYECIAAHCNFHLRGDESDRDERFVVGFCQVAGVPVKVKHMDVPAYRRDHQVSVEMACRELRYRWFGDLCRELGCQAIAVAHHQDDNVETFFLNALRGSGIAGLAAMKPRNGNVVRPLLDVSRCDIENYLSQLGRPFVVDSTNLLNDYKRNRVRNVIVPAIEREFPDARKTLAGTVSHVRDYVDLYNDLLRNLKSHITERGDGCVRISVDGLLALGVSNLPLLVFDLVREYGVSYDQAQDIAGIIESHKATGQRFNTSSHALSVTFHTIVVECIEHSDDAVIPVSADNAGLLKVKLKVDDSNGRPFTPGVCNGKTVVAVGKAMLENGKVVLRHWREGDRMHPFGLHGTKLVSDVFADAKVPPEARKRAWILDVDGEVAWVLGVRASELCRIPVGATDYVIMSYLPAGGSV